MQLYPAIDIKDGQCVRLRQGEFKEMTVYSSKPWRMAAGWEEQGATFLHLVDLDGALAGYPVNWAAIEKIVKSVSIPVEAGGGIRSGEDVRRLLGLGVRRVIIGTRAAERPEFLKEMVEAFGDRAIVAGVDARDGMAAVEGWGKSSSLTAEELCLTVKDCGVRHIVYTDISRDGMLSGPNIAAARALTELTGLDIIASGGVSCMKDLYDLHEAGIRGAIIGKALYENRLDLSQAVRLYENQERLI